MLALDKAGWFAQRPLILAETASKEKLVMPDGFNLIFTRTYGETALHFINR